MSIPSPLISLVIPVYKAERFLLDCLQSVTAEIRDECEVILVDDGSPDGSVSIIRENCGAYLDSGQFKLIRIENSGPGEARNVGVRAARGSYIGFLDSDDILLPGFFDDVLEAIRNQAADIIQFHCSRFASRNKVFSRSVRPPRRAR